MAFAGQPCPRGLTRGDLPVQKMQGDKARIDPVGWKHLTALPLAYFKKQGALKLASGSNNEARDNASWQLDVAGAPWAGHSIAHVGGDNRASPV